MKPASLASAAMLAAFAAHALAADPAPAPGPWPGSAPADCPYPASDRFSGLHFTGRHAEYTSADTWYFSWAADGNLYSPWTDGSVNGIYCLHPGGGIRRDDGIIYNWPWLGPFVGFRISKDFGKSWTESPRTPAEPLFGEHALNGEPVRIGAPHFVDFGKAMEHSPDGKAYLVGHGSSDAANRRFAYNSWITADQAYLTRVTPGIENMNDVSKYEFFAGHQPNGDAVWSNDFAKIKPIADWRDHAGCVTMTYNAPLRKYLMCVTDGGNTVSRYHTYILESDKITGPWKMAAYLRNFGEQAYFVNIPSKFISSDGKTFWLCYSANFSSGWGGITFKALPPGSRYAMCFQEVRLLTPADSATKPTPPDPTPQ